MNSKLFIWIGLMAGSAIGSYIPTLWGESYLSFSSVILSGVFAVVGIWIGFRLSGS